MNNIYKDGKPVTEIVKGITYQINSPFAIYDCELNDEGFLESDVMLIGFNKTKDGFCADFYIDKTILPYVNYSTKNKDTK